MGMEAIIALIIANLPGIIKGGEAAWQLITEIRKAAIQQDAWTPEAQAAYDSILEAFNTAEESKTDAEKGLPPLP